MREHQVEDQEIRADPDRWRLHKAPCPKRKYPPAACPVLPAADILPSPRSNIDRSRLSPARCPPASADHSRKSHSTASHLDAPIRWHANATALRSTPAQSPTPSPPAIVLFPDSPEVCAR